MPLYREDWAVGAAVGFWRTFATAKADDSLAQEHQGSVDATSSDDRAVIRAFAVDGEWQMQPPRRISGAAYLRLRDGR
jgi:hypothetical protein